MSSFDIVADILDAAPLVLGGLPKLASVIGTLRSAHRMRAEPAETIGRLADELGFAFMLLQDLETQCQGIKWKDHRVAQEFASLFESFPATAERFAAQCRIFTSKPKRLLGFTPRKLDEAVVELELHMQRLFRRTTLLLSYLQQSTRTSLASLEGDLCVGNPARLRSPRPSQIKDFLKAQLNRDSPPKVWYRDMQLHHLTRVGDFDIEYIRDTNHLAIVERRILYGDVAIESGLHATGEVVQKLSLDSPADWLGILTCNTADWVLNDADRRKICAEFTLVYNFPSLAHPNEPPETLRTLLRHADDPEHTHRPDLPLPARLSLARDIANAVLFVHVAGLVHKNIRPETILAFPPREQPLNTEGIAWKAFLAGFIESRGVTQGGNNPWAPILPDDVRYTGWDRYLYQHPSCAGPHKRQAEFTMLHDIYALGVVLLEVGLWQSLIGSVVSVYTRTHGQWKQEEHIRRPLLVFNNKLPDPDEPSQTQALLIAAASLLLPFTMGTLYTDVVVSCLKCLDEGQSETSVRGARFIERVLDRLDCIRM